ncbi:MAG: hypothetical protein ACK5JT_20010 [Hyphomicrobiaceae bacterium]
MLLMASGIFLVASILAIGVVFWWLHSLPERMVHNRLQYEIVAVLVLISLVTNEHIFWIAALLLAYMSIPEFKISKIVAPFYRMANSLSVITKATQTTTVATPAEPAAPPPYRSPYKPNPPTRRQADRWLNSSSVPC